MSYPRDKQQEAIVRLHALVAKGYRADLGVRDSEGTIRLEHPRGASAGAPELNLCSDGVIFGVDNVRPLSSGAGDPNAIGVDDEANFRCFESFLSSIPAPTMLQRLDRATIFDVRMYFLVMLICVGSTFVVAFLAKWLWRIVTR